MTVKELLIKLAELSEAGEDVAIDCRERCNCGNWIRHNNGGNYHARAWVRYDVERREFVVTLGNSREWFPGDEEVTCFVCGRTYRDDEHHAHIPIEFVDVLAVEICEHIGEGSVYLVGDGGHTTIAAVYL